MLVIYPLLGITFLMGFFLEFDDVILGYVFVIFNGIIVSRRDFFFRTNSESNQFLSRFSRFRGFYFLSSTLCSMNRYDYLLKPPRTDF